MTKNANRRSHCHTQRLEIVDQATSPMGGPITRKLRCATPELFIIGTMLSLCTSNLLNAILPILVRLILRDTTRQYDIEDTFRGRLDRESARKNNSTHLPTSIFLTLNYTRSRNSLSFCPLCRLFKRGNIAHLTKSDRSAISRTCAMHKHIAFTGNAKHNRAFLRPRTSIQ